MHATVHATIRTNVRTFCKTNALFRTKKRNQVERYNYRTRVKDIINNALKKSQCISIHISDTDSIYKSQLKYDLTNETQLCQLTNEVFSEIESYIYDYSDRYIHIITDDKWIINVEENEDTYIEDTIDNNPTNIYLIHMPIN